MAVFHGTVHAETLLTSWLFTADFPRKGFVWVPVGTFIRLRTKSDEVQKVVGKSLLISFSGRRAGIG